MVRQAHCEYVYFLIRKRQIIMQIDETVTLLFIFENITSYQVNNVVVVLGIENVPKIINYFLNIEKSSRHSPSSKAVSEWFQMLSE